ncbi:hypothetical protein C8F01DRAFT_1090054 [Mycena amicta]|nr:hypothetical protein C8F01DRAFT_1090054 [Mycena amicta]
MRFFDVGTVAITCQPATKVHHPFRGTPMISTLTRDQTGDDRELKLRIFSAVHSEPADDMILDSVLEDDSAPSDASRRIPKLFAGTLKISDRTPHLQSPLTRWTRRTRDYDGTMVMGDGRAGVQGLQVADDFKSSAFKANGTKSANGCTDTRPTQTWDALGMRDMEEEPERERYSAHCDPEPVLILRNFRRRQAHATDDGWDEGREAV